MVLKVIDIRELIHTLYLPLVSSLVGIYQSMISYFSRDSIIYEKFYEVWTLTVESCLRNCDAVPKPLMNSGKLQMTPRDSPGFFFLLTPHPTRDV